MINIYLKFCVEHSRRPLNPSVPTIVAYLQHLSNTLKSPKSVSNYYSAVKLLHFLKKVQFQNEADVEIFLINRAIPLVKRHVSVQKQPITKQHLASMARILDTQGKQGLIIKSAILTGFYGFLRSSNICPDSYKTYDPLRHFSRGDVKITSTGMYVAIKWSKSMQNSTQPQLVPIPNIEPANVDPVRTFKQMMAAVPVRPEKPMFMLDDQNVLTANKLRGVFEYLCNKINIDPDLHSLHSLRRGGATEAYVNGADPKEIQRHGGWASQVFWDYITPPVSHSSSVCVALSK